MMDLLERADPALGVEADRASIRAKVDERTGFAAPLRPTPPNRRRPWLIAAATFVAVLAFTLPILIREDPSVFAPGIEGIEAHPGVTAAVPLASGGLQLMDVDGDTIWVMTTLQNRLQQVSAPDGRIEAVYTVDARVEGVVVGGNRVWLLSPDDGGKVLRFAPQAGIVDLAISIGANPEWANWMGDGLWVGADDGEIRRISSEGDIVSTIPGELKGGQGLGYLWVNDPATDLISSLSEEGKLGDMVIPTERGLDTMNGSGIRQVEEADGLLFLLDGDHPWGTNLNLFDPASGRFGAFAGLTFGLLDLIEFDGYLWVTSSTDHVVIRIDPRTGEQRRYPMPGKAGGLAVADGALWVTLYQPGALIRLDTGADLPETSAIVIDDWNRFPHRLLCTGTENTDGPTIILQPSDWIDYGSWSVIQAEIAREGFLVCTNGYVEGETTPEQQASDLAQALAEAGIEGPYVVAATVDGVHAARLFADDREDLAGLVLVDPMPVGFPGSYDELLPEFGHPPWLDLDPVVSASLDDFGGLPLIVIEQDPESVFLSPSFIDGAGRETAESVDALWQEGLDFYGGMSSQAQSVVARGAGLDMMLWDQPDLVVESVLDVADGQIRR